MKIAVAKEILAGEKRVAALPETVSKYIAMGHHVDVEASAGMGVYVSDSQYETAGARIISNTEELFAQADLMLKVKQPQFNDRVGKHEAQMLREGSMLIAFLHPAAPANHNMIRMLEDKNITAFTMDGIPRISRAQRMDALTSMSTITGYRSVILAASCLPRFIPLLGTAIGVNPPARKYPALSVSPRRLSPAQTPRPRITTKYATMTAKSMCPIVTLPAPRTDDAMACHSLMPRPFHSRRTACHSSVTDAADGEPSVGADRSPVNVPPDSAQGNRMRATGEEKAVRSRAFTRPVAPCRGNPPWLPE